MRFRAALTQENGPRFAPCGTSVGWYEVPIEPFALFTIGRWRLICRVEREGITGQASPGTYSLTVRDAEPYSDLATTVTLEANTAITVPLILALAALTPTPATTAMATPGGPTTPTPKPGATSTAAPVTDLPNTGASDASSDGLWRAAGAPAGLALLFLLAGLLLQRRTTPNGKRR